MAEPDLELVVEGTPAEVVERLRRGLLPIGSVWFATLAELRAWDRATDTLYVRALRGGELEIGPRLRNVSAARLAPVWRVQLDRVDGGTRLVGHRRWTGTTVGLGVAWGVVLAVWLALTVRGGDAAGMLVIWAAVAVAIVVGAVGGWVAGGRALDAARPDLARAASGADDGDDW